MLNSRQGRVYIVAQHMAARKENFVCEHLENISREALEEYQAIIRNYVRRRQGVYALYREHARLTAIPWLRSQAAFVRLAIASGRFRSEEDVVEEALSLWEERERKRAEFLATLEEAGSALARGEGRIITRESMRELADEVKQRGCARLASEEQLPH